MLQAVLVVVLVSSSDAVLRDKTLRLRYPDGPSLHEAKKVE